MLNWPHRLSRCLLLVSAIAGSACAQQADLMTVARLDELVRRVDPEVERISDNQWRFNVEQRSLLLVADPAANRMRIMSPIVEAKQLPAELMMRLLQANFDSALDARYAIGQQWLWSTFIHPLGSLNDVLFLSGVGQVVNVAETFGTTYSSGEFMFGGGDSQNMQRQLLERLQRLLEQNRT